MVSVTTQNLGQRNVEYCRGFKVGSTVMGKESNHCAANTDLNRTGSWSLQRHEPIEFDLMKLKVDGAEFVLQLAKLLMQT
jgi:hypothetical protein